MDRGRGAGTAIRERRLELGLTQEELGKRAGVRRETISAIEHERRGVGDVVARRLADALQTTQRALEIPQRPTLALVLDHLEDIRDTLDAWETVRDEAVGNQERLAELLERLVDYVQREGEQVGREVPS